MDKSIPTAFLVQLLQLITTWNIFEFDGSLFRQMVGCAMGSNISVVYACAFMRDFEEAMLERWNGTRPKNWLRFIDDCWFLWVSKFDVKFQNFMSSWGARLFSMKVTGHI